MISTECSSIIGTCDPGSKLLLEEFDITFLGVLLVLLIQVLNYY